MENEKERLKQETFEKQNTVSMGKKFNHLENSSIHKKKKKFK
jgi:hypothetical protein